MRRRARSNSRVAVLTYHSIAELSDGPPGIVSATPSQFERQVAWLGRSGRAISLAELLAAKEERAPLAPGAVLVTFDDAYADFAERAWPVLRCHGVPVTLFVPTAFPDDPTASFWWDRLHAALSAARDSISTPLGALALDTADDRRRAYRTLREHVKALPHDAAMALVDDLVERLDGPAPSTSVLGWDALRALAADGVTLAAHSRTHPRLDRVADDRLAEEVAGSLADLRREVGAAAPAFAYPAGGLSSAAIAAVRDAGFELAFATTRGVADLAQDDPLALPRLNVGRRTTPRLLRATLSGPGLTALRRMMRGAGGASAPEGDDGASRAPAVAYVMSRFPKVSETFILTEVLALQRRGVRVELYPLLRERPALVHPEAAPLVAGAHYLPFLSRAIVASQLHWLRRRPRAYLGALRDLVAGTRGSLNFLGGGLAVFPKVAHAARLMQDDGVAHVHCHFANHPAAAGFVIGRLTGLPYSFTAHGSDLHVERRMLPEKVAEAAFVATVSDYNRRLIVNECGGRFADKVHVVRAGVDTQLFAPHRNGRRPAGPLTVLCVGTLHEVKGQAHLVEACRLLVAHGVDVACRLLGDGPDRAMLERRVCEAGLEQHVTLVGACTREQIAAELQRTDVLVAPSVLTRSGKREGIPVVLMEAMSSGVPVVASDLSGIPELVEDEVSGLLVAPGDAAALAVALRRLRDEPELRGRLGRCGRERVEAEFDLEHSAAELARRFGMQTTERSR